MMRTPILILDIGTTTIKGLLFDKANRKTLSSHFLLNEQVKFGEDVISRIGFSLKSARDAKRLRLAAVNSVNKLIKILSRESLLKPTDIKEAVVVCNTAMHHLLLGLSAECLVRPPYKSLHNTETIVKAQEVGIRISKGAPVTILPNIGGFIGSDAIGLIIASDIYKSASIKLAIDIGTNGEIVLGSSKKILVASTAAGPAFESTKRAYGSDLIDAIAEMLKKGCIDRTGRVKNPSLITQDEVRKIQLAKAAIYAAIRILMKHLNIKTPDISKVLITGSFGNAINPEHAVLIGLIPEVSTSRVEFMNDAPIEGAKKYILSRRLQKNLPAILSKVKRIPLARKDFQQIYADSMAFGGSR